VHEIEREREEGSNAGPINRKKHEESGFFFFCSWISVGNFLQRNSAEKLVRKKREKWANFLKDYPTESCHMPSAEFCWPSFDGVAFQIELRLIPVIIFILKGYV